MKLKSKLLNAKLLAVLLALTSASLMAIPSAVYAANDAYSDGAYGACTYDNCGVSLSSNGTVGINVIVGSSTTCTTQSDSVLATTDSSTGYTLTLNDNATTSALLGSGSPTVPTSSATQASPTTMATNTWGYRVDGLTSFGSGPTSATNNVAPSSLTFAGIPVSNVTGDTLATDSAAADPGVTTTVWYGICVNATVPADTYSSTVVYTAVVN